MTSQPARHPTRHTPGPWTAELAHSDYFITYNTPTESYLVATVAEDIEAARGVQRDEDEAEANAHLIAAAPDLLDALARLVAADNCNYQRDTMRSEGLFDAARAAIAKATGGQA